MYQYALHALYAAKREEKNRLLMYHDVEAKNSGLDICLMIDAATHQIVEMNAAGQIALGISGAKASGMTCYQLLHNRTEPCQFCFKKVIGKEYIRECFVPRLNRMMHVQEYLEDREDRTVRMIQLREDRAEQLQSAESLELLTMLEDYWSQTEKGGLKELFPQAFLEYIGRTFKAYHILLFKKADMEWKQDKTWSVNGFVEHSHEERNTDILEHMLAAVFPRHVLFIEDENSEGYEYAVRYDQRTGLLK